MIKKSLWFLSILFWPLFGLAISYVWVFKFSLNSTAGGFSELLPGFVLGLWISALKIKTRLSKGD